jgi:hypothetical protein
MMPPPEELDASSTITTGSIIGSDMPPAKAVDAAAVSAAARTSFFIISSRIRLPPEVKDSDKHPRLTS